MSPVFRHGGLRLYLLKLLDEAPRHGYDVIRLLQDRFLGVYSPSPGTIYPRLARLEEEGLVTHEVVDGKKVYYITDAGRAELHRRFDELSELEDELAASVRDIAKELSRDVRQTVRNLREELTWAVRESNRGARPPARPGPEAADGPEQAESREASGAAQTREATGSEHTSGSRAPDGGDDHANDGRPGGASGERRGWADWADRQDWRAWADWASRYDPGRHDWARQHEAGQHGAGQHEADDRAEQADQGGQSPGMAGHADQGGRTNQSADSADRTDDFGRIVAGFVRQIHRAIWHADGISDEAVRRLGTILAETADRIRREVLADPKSDHDGGSSASRG